MLSNDEYGHAIGACWCIRSGVDDLLIASRAMEITGEYDASLLRDGIGRLCNALDAVHEVMRRKASSKGITHSHDLRIKANAVLPPRKNGANAIQ